MLVCFADRAIIPAGAPVTQAVPDGGAMLTSLGALIPLALGWVSSRRRKQ